MNKKDKKILFYIFTALENNLSAHAGKCVPKTGHTSDELFRRKQKNINIALSLLRGSKNSRIKYKIIKEGDQGGNASLLFYFEWKEKGEILQVSFHSPSKKEGKNDMRNHIKPLFIEGEKTISWKQEIKGAYVLQKYGDKYLNLTPYYKEVINKK